MRIAVVVPTYSRPEQLQCCLRGMLHQTRAPDDVLVVVRVDDDATRSTIDEWSNVLPVRPITVTEPGLVYALNAGLAAATADVVAFTDDDAVPRAPWLARIEATLQDPQIAAVGGRDVTWMDKRIVDDRDKLLAARLKPGRNRGPVVGRVQPFGRTTGNHDAGVGPARDVDILKGVNMAYRRELVAALGFDSRLRGSGSQVHNEPSICLPLRAAGWRIVYDPAITVDHYRAVRAAADDREPYTAKQMYDKSFNETLSLWPYLDRRWQPAYVAWTVTVGTIWCPGLAQVVRHIRRGTSKPWRILIAAQRARFDAISLLRNSPPRPSAPMSVRIARPKSQCVDSTADLPRQ